MRLLPVIPVVAKYGTLCTVCIVYGKHHAGRSLLQILEIRGKHPLRRKH